MPTLEEIVYEAGRHALAEQERVVAGIQQRAGALLAAHALAASFLGAPSLRSGLEFAGVVALVAFVVGLVAGTTLLAPSTARFSVDPARLHPVLQRRSEGMPGRPRTSPLLEIAALYQHVHDRNARGVRRMSLISVVLCASVVVQTLGWLASLV